ncbi:MAG: SDR family NAD(P)-dependent oxidoreductase [Gammaproteobacteria bacterium]
MGDRLNGKIAVITGGSSGIGLASAKRFLQDGAQLVIVGRYQKTLDAAAKELGNKVLAIRADVSNLSDLDNLYSQVKEKFSRIDVLFANAGIASFMPFEHFHAGLGSRSRWRYGTALKKRDLV